MNCSAQTLWPYHEDRPVIQETAVYPDVFVDPLADTNDLSAADPYANATVLSVLPLLRIAGATVEARLSDRITHVLCDLVGSVRTLSFGTLKPEHLSHPEHFDRLRESIRKASLLDDRTPDIISSAWVRSEVWKKPQP